MKREWRIAGLALAFFGLMVGPVWAVGQVELNLAVDRQAPLTIQQTWARELGQAGATNVRLRQANTGDRPGIETRGSQESPYYVVTGLIDSRGEIVLPGGRYRSGQAGRVVSWLRELARLGPPEAREPIVAFNLPRSRMAAVREDLAGAVDFSTKGMNRTEVARRIGLGLKLPLRMDEKLIKTTDDDLVGEELKGLSRGTALACVLRPLGLALAPRMGASEPEYLVVVTRGGEEVWPVGWTPEESRSQLAPKLFEFATISLENASIGKAVEGFGGRLDVPIVFDRAALAKEGIDTAKKTVNFPKTRTTYIQAMERALFQAGLKGELRVDEAGKPFYWITTL